MVRPSYTLFYIRYSYVLQMVECPRDDETYCAESEFNAIIPIGNSVFMGINGPILVIQKGEVSTLKINQCSKLMVLEVHML